MTVVSRKDVGFTLLELLIVVTILGIMITGLQQIMSTALTAYDNAKAEQALLVPARYAMERMAMFIQETDAITQPVDVSDGEILIVNERALDTYNNSTHAYDVDGDGYLDADNDSNNLVNDHATDDPADLITFALDKTDSDNWRLTEKLPNYSTDDKTDFLATRELAEHVTSFACNLIATDLVEIELTLSSGSSDVSLKTRVKSRMID